MSEVIKFELKDAVKKHGNKSQKDGFKKNKGNLKTNQFNSLIKTMEQHYKKVWVEGKGSKRVIYCEGKLSKKRQRETNYDNCGQGQLDEELEKNVKSLITSFLYEDGRDKKSFSLSGWCDRLELISDEMTTYLQGFEDEFHEKMIEKFETEIDSFKKSNETIKELDELGLVEGNHLEEQREEMKEFIDKTIHYKTKKMKDLVNSIFKKLDKDKIITHKTETYALTKDDKYEVIDSKTVKNAEKIRKELLEKFGVKNTYTFSRNERKKFNIALEKKLVKELGIKRYYDRHTCKIRNIRKLKQMDMEQLGFRYDLDEQGRHLKREEVKKFRGNEWMDKTQNKHGKNSQYAQMWKVVSEELGYVKQIVKGEVEVGGITIEFDFTEKVNPLQQLEDVKNGKFKVSDIEVTEEMWMNELGYKQPEQPTSVLYYSSYEMDDSTRFLFELEYPELVEPKQPFKPKSILDYVNYEMNSSDKYLYEIEYQTV